MTPEFAPETRPRPKAASPTIPAERALTITTKRMIAVTFTPSDRIEDLKQVSSALDEIRLLVRHARRRGMSFEEFVRMIAVRNEADALAQAAKRAREKCERLLKAAPPALTGEAA